MRALVFSSLYPNEVAPQFGLFVARRAESLAARGVDVRVVAPVPWFPRHVPLRRWARYARVPKREERAGLVVTHPRYPHLPGPGMYVQAWSLYRAVLAHVRALRREFTFDFLDAHYAYPDGVAATHIAHALGIPCVITARGSDINLLPRFRLVRRQVVEALGDARALVAVSGALGEKMLHLGAAPDKLHVVPNGIDRDRFSYGDAEAARHRLGVAHGEKLLLSVGNLNELKGHATMIEAVARLREADIDVRLRIFGEGEERENLERRVAQLGVGDRVVLHGSVANEELAPWYRAATLFVLASSREGWPNVLNEALACGLPVVSTSVGGVPEIVTPGTNGILVAERSAASLAGAIRQALLRDWDRAALAREASRRDWSAVADQLIQIYTAMLQSPSNVSEAQVPHVLTAAHPS